MMLENKKKIVVIGATSAIAEHCARLWVTDSTIELILIGRDRTKTERIAADLQVRSPTSNITCRQADFVDPRRIRALADQLAQDHPLDIVLIAHGYLPDQMHCQDDLSACQDALTINGLSPVLFAEAFAKHMQKANRGTLALISSVAGDRGRQSNYVYGAAKGMVTRYAQGLQHRLADSAVQVVLIKPGPTDTPMTAELKTQGKKLANVEQVARAIVSAIHVGKPLVYTPGIWAWIMQIIRHLPNFIFNKMSI